MVSFSFVSRYFFTAILIYSVTNCLVASMCLSFFFFCIFFFPLTFVSCHIVLWLKKNDWYDFSLLKFTKIFCGLACDLFWRLLYVHLKECVFYCFWMDCFLYMSIKLICSIVSFKASSFLLIFSLDYLSTDTNVVLKSNTIIVLLSISPFIFVSICFVYLGSPMLGT